MTGKNQPKKADTTGGSTPLMIAKETGLDLAQLSRKPTYAVSWLSEGFGIISHQSCGELIV